MPFSSSSTTTVVTNATNNKDSVPLFYGLATPTALTDNNKNRFALSSPTSSPIELAPLVDICDSVDNRPLSPDSPEQKCFSLLQDDRFQPLQSPFKKKENKSLLISPSLPPAFLEPTPQFDIYSATRLPPTLDALFKHDSIQDQRTTIPTLHIPVPRRSTRPSMIYQQTNLIATPTTSPPTISKVINTVSSPSSSSSTSKLSYPMSPTMAAASASAATSASFHHPGSQVAESLLKNIGSHHVTRKISLDSIDSCSPEEDKFRFMSPTGTDPYSKTCVDQNMFLTKNSHIKRPRNAWIHFRCHYGQALKTQDPTLRAEEISKRASRRWSKLSENEKKPWHDLAEQEKLAHREAFPEYRYCPRRSNAPYSPPKRSRTDDDYSNKKKSTMKRKTK